MKYIVDVEGTEMLSIEDIISEAIERSVEIYSKVNKKNLVVKINIKKFEAKNE